MTALNSILDIFSNYPFIAATVSWAVAQITKVIIVLIYYKDEMSSKLFLSSGGMPSSHAAAVCALSMSIALKYGLADPLFAVSALLSFIVVYDAAGVRRSTGEQAKTLNQLITELSDDKQISDDKKVKEVLGHTPLQVVVGSLLGIVISVLFSFLY
jgi:acid phosphatase family membrane protein YuiD